MQQHTVPLYRAESKDDIPPQRIAHDAGVRAASPSLSILEVVGPPRYYRYRFLTRQIEG